MTQMDRIDCLEKRRLALKEQIAAEQSRPHPDELALRRMKTEKCRLKDQIAALHTSDAVATSSAA